MADLKEILKQASILSRELAELIKIITEAVDFDDVRKIDKYHFWQGLLTSSHLEEYCSESKLDDFLDFVAESFNEYSETLK